MAQFGKHDKHAKKFDHGYVLLQLNNPTTKQNAATFIRTRPTVAPFVAEVISYGATHKAPGHTGGPPIADIIVYYEDDANSSHVDAWLKDVLDNDPAGYFKNNEIMVCASDM